MHQIRPSHLTLLPQIKEQAVRAFAGGSEKKKKLFGKASGGTGKSFGDLARKAVTQDRAAAPTAAPVTTGLASEDSMKAAGDAPVYQAEQAASPSTTTYAPAPAPASGRSMFSYNEPSESFGGGGSRGSPARGADRIGAAATRVNEPGERVLDFRNPMATQSRAGRGGRGGRGAGRSHRHVGNDQL